MGYSGFAIEVSPSADCVFALAMLIEKGAELYEEAGCTHWSEPSVASARCSWRRVRSWRPRCSRLGGEASNLRGAVAVLWLWALDGQWGKGWGFRVP